MPYRIFMTIQRGTMDKTAVCVFPWERPLLEEIHGGNAEAVGIEQMASLKDAAKVVTVKLNERVVVGRDGQEHTVKPALAPALQAQLEAMSKVKPAENPFNNLEAEFGRLAQKYGKHPNVDMPVVEKVYGSLANFRVIASAYRGDKPPKNDPMYPDTDYRDDSQGAEEAVDVGPSEMTYEQLKAALTQRGVTFKGNAPRETLEELLIEQLATA